uniref:Interleukin-6 n=2 Tax=Athene cunicularia TaxID=194338 RepID=A0A663MJT5_ATHCN
MGTLALGEGSLRERLKFPPHLAGRQKEIRQQIRELRGISWATLPLELNVMYFILPMRGSRRESPGGAASGQGATKPLGVSPQMCEKFTICGNSMEMLVQNNLNLPKVTEEDGCMLAGFDEDKCLKKISSGLYTFQTYLEYIQETFTSEKQNVESLCYSTEHLAHTIRQMVINPDEVTIPDSATQQSLRTKLKSDKTWIEKITTHLILRDFTSFMEKTVRAVRYLKNTRSFSV